MSRIRPILVLLALAACVHRIRADEAVTTLKTNSSLIAQPPPSDQPSPDRKATFPPDNEPSYHIEAGDIKIELSGEHRHVFGGDYRYLAGATLSILGAPTDEDSFGLVGGIGAVQLANGSSADQLVHQPVYSEAGIVARHYFTPSHVFLRPYITLSAAYFHMGWSYRTPIMVGNESVASDCVEGVDASAGVGLSVRLHERVKLFGEMSAGGTAVLCETTAGIDNNFLGSFGYIGVKAGLSASF